MADKMKIPLFVLVALVLASLFLSAGVFFLLQKEKARATALQTELNDLKAVQKVTEAKLAESKKMIADLELKLQESQAQIATLTQNLEEEKAAREQASGEMQSLQAELKEQKELRMALETKLTQAQEDTKKIQAQLKEMDGKKAALEARIKELEAQIEEIQAGNIELGKIVVGTEGEAASPERGAAKTEEPAAKKEAPAKQPEKKSAPAFESKVLVVNKEYNFVVINMGTKDGVRVGDVFSVYHNNKYVGDVKVDKVHDSMAAAGFTSPDMKDKVGEGDKVVRKGK